MLTVAQGNEVAISLYERHGFKTYGVEPRAMKNGSEYRDEILMALIFDLEKRMTPYAKMLPQASLQDFASGAIDFVAADGRFIGLLAGGSAITGNTDAYSDLDLILVVRDDAYAEVLASRRQFADSLGHLLPSLRGDLAAVTAGRALDMTGGLPDLGETLSLLGVPQGAAVSREERLEVLYRLTDLNFPSGHEISYSNTGYRLLDAALLRRGVGFADLVRDRIAGPLGIGFRVPETWVDPIRGLAPGYWKGGSGAWQLATSGRHLSASGCLTGSLHDLVRWQQAVLADRRAGARACWPGSAPPVTSPTGGRPATVSASPGRGSVRAGWSGMAARCSATRPTSSWTRSRASAPPWSRTARTRSRTARR